MTMKKTLHRVKMAGMTAACSFLLAFALPAGQVQAFEAVQAPDGFEELEGDAQYLGSLYRDNYILDIEETGALQIHWEAINGVANAIFSGIRTISYATVSFFYWAVKFDMADIFRDQLNGVQAALKDSVFEPLFVLAMAACLVTIITKFVKRDVAGSVMEAGKVVLVVILSMLVVLKSDAVLSNATNITKEISIDALSSVNNSLGTKENINDFAAEAAGVLWVDLVHEPWKTVEFMHADKNEERINSTAEEFLEKDDAEGRADLVKEYDDWECFKMTIGFERVGFLLIYFFPCLAKCLLFIVIAGALLIFQALAVLYLLLAPLMLLLFLFADYERILTSWLRKLLETQVMILVIMVMLSLLIKADKYFFDMSDTYGWFVSLIMQITVGIGLFANRGKIFTFLDTVQRGTATPRYAANRLRMGGNINTGINTIKKNAASVGKSIGQRAATIRNIAGGGSLGGKAAGTSAGAAADGQKSALAYRTAQKQGSPVTVTTHPDPTTADRLQRAGANAKRYVQSGGVGRDAGRAAAAVAGAPAYVKDSLGMAKDRVKSAPIQFRYSAATQADKAKAAAADMKQAAGDTWNAVKGAADQTVQGVVKAADRNVRGYHKGYAGQADKRQEQAEKRKAYTESVAAKKTALDQAAARRQEQKTAKREARKYIRKDSDKTNAQKASE